MSLRSVFLPQLIWLVVFLSTVLIDVDLGLFIGLGFSLLTVVYRTQTYVAHLNLEGGREALDKQTEKARARGCTR